MPVSGNRSETSWRSWYHRARRRIGPARRGSGGHRGDGRSGTTRRARLKTGDAFRDCWRLTNFGEVGRRCSRHCAGDSGQLLSSSGISASKAGNGGGWSPTEPGLASSRAPSQSTTRPAIRKSGSPNWAPGTSSSAPQSTTGKSNCWLRQLADFDQTLLQPKRLVLRAGASSGQHQD
jgi:hypothetical protein